MRRRVRSGTSHGPSLRLRIAAVVLLAVVPVLGVLGWAVTAERRSDRRDADRTLVASSELIAAHEARLLADVSGMLAVLAGDARLRTSACPRVLASGLASQPVVDNLGVIAPDGAVVCSGRPLARRSAVSGTSLLSAVRRAGGFATTRYELSDITHRPAIHAGRPLRFRGRAVGVVFASLRADWLAAAVTPATVPAGGAVALLAEDGTVMARVPPEGLPGRRPSASPVVAAALTSGPGTTRRLTGVDGVPRLWAFRPLGPAGAPTGRLVVGRSEASLYAPTERLVRATLLAGAVAAVAAALAAWALGTRLVRRPVARILDVTRRLENGDVAARVGSGSGGELAAVGAGIDRMADALAAREERFRALALHDFLTGLANRRLVSDRIDQAVARAARTGEHFTLIFADLDRFKAINDTLGHDVGDAVLVEVARRLRRELRPSDTAARLGGDEFVVVCEGLGRQATAAWTKAVALANRLAAALEPDVVCGAHLVAVEASFGVSVPTGAPRGAEELLRDADTAMYRAKSAGGGRVAVFDAAARDSVLSRLELQTALRQHLDALELHYQPIVDLTTWRPVGTEALARWSHPTRGPVPASEFIAVAEQSGLIVRLGERVIDLVAGHLATAPMGRRRVHVNVSAVQLARSDVAGGLLRALGARDVSPESVSVEITESALMEPGGSARAQLTAMRQAGTRVGVDDFGTGYASLAALRRLPLDFVKVDRRFVAGMLSDRRDRAVVRSVISLAGELGLDVVAEGVETAAQADALGSLGCGYAQGWLFGRPTASPQVVEVLGE